jgi:hypothetical protein
MKKTGDGRSGRLLGERTLGGLRLGAFLLGAFLLSFSSGSSAADRSVSVEASVDAMRAGLLDTVELAVTVNTENLSRDLKPQLPALDAFSVLTQRATTSTSMSMVNGKISKTKTITYTYTLKPLKKGTFTIDPVSVSYEGVTYKTDPITLTIVEGSVNAGKNRGRNAPGTERQFDPEKMKNDIFILVKPNRSEIYQGEQLFLTYTLFSRYDIDSLSLRESPDFPGFYKEDVYSAERLEGKKESFNGKLFETTVLRKVAVFPLRPGSYSPKPLVLEVTLLLKGDDQYSFFEKPYTFMVPSNDIVVEVKPLPPPPGTTGRDFSQIVGELNMGLSKRENTVNTGEATVCYLTLKSTGNLNNVSDPGIRLSKRSRVYLSDTITDRVEENGRTWMIRKFEYTLIPEEGGTLEVSSGELLFFDLGTGNYIFAKSEPIQISVTGRDIFPEKPIISSRKDSSSSDFRYIKGDVRNLRSAGKGPFESPLYYLVHLVLAAATIVLLFMRLNKESLEKNEELFKKKKARSTAMELLSSARARIEKKEYTPAIDLTYQAFLLYLAGKAGKNPREVSLKNVGDIVGSCFETDAQALKDVRGILEQSIQLKFSSDSIERARHAEPLHRKALSMIERLELSSLDNRRRRKKG